MATQHGTETGYDLEEPPVSSWEEMIHFLSSGSALNKRTLFTAYLLVYQRHMFRELRKRLEDPDCPEVSWDRPYCSEEVEVEWTWTVSDASTSQHPQHLQHLVTYDKPDPSLTPLSVLTAGAAVLKEGEMYYPLLPGSHLNAVDDLDSGPSCLTGARW